MIGERDKIATPRCNSSPAGRTFVARKFIPWKYGPPIPFFARRAHNGTVVVG
jgi:hypothetical protein